MTSVDWESEQVKLTLRNAGMNNLSEGQRRVFDAATSAWYEGKTGKEKGSRGILLRGVVDSQSDIPILRSIESTVDVFTTIAAASRGFRAGRGTNPQTTYGGNYSSELPKSGR